MKGGLFLCCLAIIVFSACGKSKSGGGGGGAKTPAVSDETKTFLAANVFLGSSMALASETNPVLDSVTKVRPEQILLSEDSATVGRLKSKNLRDALENEVAPDWERLAGTRWKVTNLVEAGSNGFTQTGELEIVNATSIKVLSGSVEALGAASEYADVPCNWYCTKEFIIQRFSSGMAVIRAIPEITSMPNRGVLLINIENLNKIVLTGQPPSGYQGLLKVSVLERQQ